MQEKIRHVSNELLRSSRTAVWRWSVGGPENRGARVWSEVTREIHEVAAIRLLLASCKKLTKNPRTRSRAGRKCEDSGRDTMCEIGGKRRETRKKPLTPLRKIKGLGVSW